MVKGEENENLTEMVTYFKNRIMTENCFHTTFGAQKLEGNGMQPIKNNTDLTIGFVRDQHDEEEFYMEITAKEKNQKTGKKETLRIPVDDIDEIEHIDGTLKFYIHY
jgi:hypothetical protein